MQSLVSPQWLAAALGAPDLIVLDASYTATLPGAPAHDPRAAFAREHIPGARFLDLDTLVDAASPLPSTRPDPALVAARLTALGVPAGARLVLYDEGPHHVSCRAWWVLRLAGFDAALLDGGLAAWRAEGRPLDSGDAAPVAPTVPPLAAAAPLAQVRTLDQMQANLASRAEQVADARSAARFTGAESDPRPGCAAGHIPGARSLPYSRFFEADGRWKQPDAIARCFADAGVDPARPLVATCGSGITAAVIVFAAHLLGHDAALYDGSWTEWGSDPATPKALGDAA